MPGGHMRSALIVLTALIATGCARLPDNDAAKAVFVDKIRAESKGASFQITSFDKANGQTFETNGVKGYRFFYSSAVTFPAGFHPECAKEGFTGFDCGFIFNTGGTALRPIPRGTTVGYSGVIEFQQTEKGWIPDQLSLAEVSRSAGPDDTQQRLSGESSFITGRNRTGGGGVEVMFQTPSAESKERAADITEIWPQYLEKAGVESYTLDWQAPDRIVLCLGGSFDLQRVKASLMSNTFSARDLRVIEELPTTDRFSTCRK
jgi:hypothetical protein